MKNTKQSFSLALTLCCATIAADAATPTPQELSYSIGVTSALQTQIAALAAVDAVALTNKVTVAGYRTIWVDASAMITTSTNGAESVTYAFASSNNVGVTAYAFDDATAESTEFKIAMPDVWDRGTIKVKFYLLSGASSGAALFAVAGSAASHDDPFGVAMGTFITVTNTITAADDLSVSPATAAITVAGTPALGDVTLFKVIRSAAGAADTLVGDARLIGLAIQYRESAAAPAVW